MANNTDLAAAIRLLAEKMTQDRAKCPETAGEMFERLAKVKPPYYKGQSDPTVLENWIREFEKLFEVVNCHENMRVGQAVLYLKDDADLWWRERESGARLSVIVEFNWDAFVIALREKFYPAFMRKQKAQEFINLSMGTISEYYDKFISLSRFAPEVVATAELKAQRFEQGLTDEIQLELGGETFTSLDVVYGRASHIYSLQSRRDKKNGVVCEERKDFNDGGNQGNFKRN
ncbi:uncharacterized protein LOC130589916 [Beta vulgaris subsp. vulgaris]|uniref:uncharacterized protein LOC130589916 n=1 Tax=Beta vulgaris subsp. vulgaris TaxID=3555 RepID=UPI0025468C7E|nr:uncharacterized protein LOC130589916 [Beta vulgaris subsp. vulgaris]